MVLLVRFPNAPQAELEQLERYDFAHRVARVAHAEYRPRAGLPPLEGVAVGFVSVATGATGDSASGTVKDVGGYFFPLTKLAAPDSSAKAP